MILQFARNSRMAVAGIRPLSSGNRVRGRTSSTSTRTSYEFSRLATQYDEVSRHIHRIERMKNRPATNLLENLSATEAQGRYRRNAHEAGASNVAVPPASLFHKGPTIAFDASALEFRVRQAGLDPDQWKRS
jgi:hypothetical protein